jgi:Family of unknown function (DUF5808)
MARRTRRASILRWSAWVLTGAAILQELRQPPDERTWHGKVAGVVPYDFRMPTIRRIRESWWAPNDDRIFTKQVWGVGWTLNVGRVVRLIKESSSS